MRDITIGTQDGKHVVVSDGESYVLLDKKTAVPALGELAKETGSAMIDSFQAQMSMYTLGKWQPKRLQERKRIAMVGAVSKGHSGVDSTANLIGVLGANVTVRYLQHNGTATGLPIVLNKDLALAIEGMSSNKSKYGFYTNSCLFLLEQRYLGSAWRSFVISAMPVDENIDWKAVGNDFKEVAKAGLETMQKTMEVLQTLRKYGVI